MKNEITADHYIHKDLGFSYLDFLLQLLLSFQYYQCGAFMQAKSCVRPDYMSSQQDINSKMRAILIDWLIEVQKHGPYKLF